MDATREQACQWRAGVPTQYPPLTWLRQASSTCGRPPAPRPGEKLKMLSAALFCGRRLQAAQGLCTHRWRWLRQQRSMQTGRCRDARMWVQERCRAASSASACARQAFASPGMVLPPRRHITDLLQRPALPWPAAPEVLRRQPERCCHERLVHSVVRHHQQRLRPLLLRGPIRPMYCCARQNVLPRQRPAVPQLPGGQQQTCTRQSSDMQYKQSTCRYLHIYVGTSYVAYCWSLGATWWHADVPGQL